MHINLLILGKTSSDFFSPLHIIYFFSKTRNCIKSPNREVELISRCDRFDETFVFLIICEYMCYRNLFHTCAKKKKKKKGMEGDPSTRHFRFNTFLCMHTVVLFHIFFNFLFVVFMYVILFLCSFIILSLMIMIFLKYLCTVIFLCLAGRKFEVYSLWGFGSLWLEHPFRSLLLFCSHFKWHVVFP